MVIGIDARAATEEPAGRGRVARELLGALAARDDHHRYLLYARTPWDGAVLDDRFAWRHIGGGDPWWHVRVARSASRRCEVFLALDTYLIAPLLRGAAGVTFVHDVLAFDPLVATNRRSTLIERLTLGPAVRRSDRLVCTTHATADALLGRFSRADGKLDVVPLAPSPAVPDPIGLPKLPERFVLAVGTLEPRKNLPRLAAAYAGLPPALQADHPLVVAGRRGWETDETERALTALGDRCVRLGYVSDGALAELYRRCTVFCYPSLGEGFGLPVLEAQHAGAPTITSNRSSLPEVADDAAVLVDPTSTAAIAAALRGLLEDRDWRERLARAGPPHAAAFSWERTAAGLLSVLARAAGASAPTA